MIRQIAGCTFCIAVIITGIFYQLFDHYLASVGEETIRSWLKSEENDITQGNLLASVTKTQKVLLASNFLKGLVIYDMSGDGERALMEFGEVPLFSRPSQSFQIISAGFLQKTVLVKAPNDPNLIICFSIFSKELVKIYCLTDFVFLFLLVGFALVVIYVKKKEQLKVEAYAKRARQASHDLAMPIMSLNSVIDLLREKSAAVHTLTSVIDRINIIVDDLIAHKRKNTGSTYNNNQDHIAIRIEKLIDEKRLILDSKIRITPELDYGDISDLNGYEADLIRSLANLIDNSAEAMSAHGGTINVRLDQWDTGVGLSVTDDGVGIPADILPLVGQSKFTHGKGGSGTGIGVLNTREFCESLGGTLSIESKVGVGTTVKITIPKKNKSLETLFLTPDTELLVLDDDDNCLSLWKKHIDKMCIPNKISYFAEPASIINYLNRLSRLDQVFLFSDFNLKSLDNGLDIIEKFNLQQQSVLVTGEYFFEDVNRRAKLLKIPIYPKPLLNQLSIQFI
jgi:hypothetical protein